MGVSKYQMNSVDMRYEYREQIVNLARNQNALVVVAHQSVRKTVGQAYHN